MPPQAARTGCRSSFAPSRSSPHRPRTARMDRLDGLQCRIIRIGIFGTPGGGGVRYGGGGGAYLALPTTLTTCTGGTFRTHRCASTAYLVLFRGVLPTY